MSAAADMASPGRATPGKGTPTAQAGVQLEAIHVRRGPVHVLRGVSLQLQAGEVLGVLGANGAGKSTLLGAMAGELPVSEGRVLLGDTPISALSALQQARLRVVLPQHASLAFPLPVETVVTMGAYPFPELPPADVAALVAQSLEQVDLPHLSHASYMRLSGGERQRVQFARVLVQLHAALRCTGTACLLLDEPVSSLDPRHQQGVLATARALAQAHGVAVLTVLHDLNLAARWCDRLAIMAHGEFLACGTPIAVLTPDTLERAYGLRPTVVPHPVAADRPLVLFD